jgi:hypothetical protein
MSKAVELSYGIIIRVQPSVDDGLGSIAVGRIISCPQSGASVGSHGPLYAEHDMMPVFLVICPQEPHVARACTQLVTLMPPLSMPQPASLRKDGFFLVPVCKES